MPSLSLILPAYNEAANVQASVGCAVEVLVQMLGAGQISDWEVVLVDDGSADATGELVEAMAQDEPRIRLVQHSTNRGYGAALRTGFRAARRDLIFFTDTDLQFDIRELACLLPRIREVDIVAGYRAPRQDPWNRRLNAWAWGLLVGGLFDLELRDVNCAFKLFRREVLDGMAIRAGGAMVNTEVLVRARTAGYRVEEVPVSHFPRGAGVQTGANPRVVARAFLELSRLYRELRPRERASERGERVRSSTLVRVS